MADKYTIFFKGECEMILKKVMNTIYDKLEAFQYIPVAPAEGPGLETLTWRSFTAVGIAKIISDYVTDIPSVEVYGAEQSATVRHLGISYGWDKFEVERAQRAGRRLVDNRSAAARLGIETAVDNIAWLGDPQYNINGFINYPGISECVLKTADGSVSKKWEDKTPTEMAQDIIDVVDTILTTTSNKETPDTVLLPSKCYRLASVNFVDNDKQMSVLDFIKKTNPMIKTWGSVNKLNNAGAGGAGRIMCYTKSNDKLEFHLPVPVSQEAPERHGLRYETILTADVAGVTCYYPASICYADGAC